MTFRFCNTILDQHIAPGASTFTEANIPDMSNWAKESQYWVANFFLNSALTATFAAPMNAYAYNFLRRAKHAFSQHDAARNRTLRFLELERQAASIYADALFHWECFLGQAWHAYALLATAFNANGKVFDQKDGSVHQRLNALYNQMKHVESRIEGGQMLPCATVPVWLENEGLRSVDETLSFVETAEILKELAKFADILANPKAAKVELSKLEVDS